MRDFGIGTIDAVNEYVDNSIDAGAGDIWISLSEDSEGRKTLIIEDNGRGIKQGNIQEVLRYGGRIDQPEAKVGKFGFGLPASSICQSDRTDIWTNHENEDNGFYRSYLDIEYLGDNGNIPPQEPEELPTDEYNLNLDPSAGHGTVIVLKELRNPDYVKISTLVRHIKEQIGRVQRHQMVNGVNIYVNGEEIPIRDPLMMIEGSKECQKFGKSEPWSEGTIEFSADGYSGEIEYKIVILPVGALQSVSRKERTDYGINQDGQGFYLVRNDREIKGGVTLSIYAKNNDLNYFRCELQFSEDLDTAFGIETNKSRCSLSDRLRPTLEREIGDQIPDIRDRIREIKSENQSSDRDTYDAAEKAFNESSAWMPPNAVAIDQQTRKEQENNADEELQNIRDKIHEGDGDLDYLKELEYRLETIKKSEGHVYEFEVAQPSENGFYGYENHGKLLKTKINPNHIFYKEIFSDLEDTNNPLDQIYWELFLMAMVKAENEARNEDQKRFFRTLRQNLSSSLSTLLSELQKETE
ncbi:ATP-binding protein [Halorubrum ezzemoulense]|uniref:ATP-binding protein n=1 Tax=Halorubrum ezzemoulense TaxID=337243 RepID=UPI00232D396B|nr:ATP-binding protein [Halorubrum ezzemoulense]MDB2283051.1 ATP-binding protein [Halorubrum ezzemoulense]